MLYKDSKCARNQDNDSAWSVDSYIPKFVNSAIFLCANLAEVLFHQSVTRVRVC